MQAPVEVELDVAVAPEAQTATRTLYESLWRQHGGEKPTPSDAEKTAAIGAMLLELAKALDRNVTQSVRLYVAALWDLNPTDLVRAFARTTEEDRYWPTPARLRELSGRASMGDPLEREADKALLWLIRQMRYFGWKLQPKIGAIVATDSPDGRLLEEPKRAPTEYPPRLNKYTHMALECLGWGDRDRGLAILSDHPGVRGDVSDGFDKAGAGEFRRNTMKEADELRRRWFDAWRMAKTRY